MCCLLQIMMLMFKYLNNYKELFIIDLVNLFYQYKLVQQISNKMLLTFFLLINNRLKHNSAYCKFRSICLYFCELLRVIMIKH